MGAKIPQDVTREDKLVGPLTLKQFLYVLGTAGIVFIIYNAFTMGALYFIEFLVLALLVTAFGLSLAFLNINGRPFGVFIINLGHFLTISRRRIWHKQPRSEASAMKVKADDIKDTKTEVQDRKSGKEVKMQIEHLAHILDTGGTMKEGQAEVMSSAINTFSPAAPSNTEPLDVEDVLVDSD